MGEIADMMIEAEIVGADYDTHWMDIAAEEIERQAKKRAKRRRLRAAKKERELPRASGKEEG